MKKMLLLIFFMLFTLLPLSVSAAEYHGYLRVGLFFGSTAKDSVTLKSDGGFSVGYGEARGFEKAYDMIENEITISTSETGNYKINGTEFDCIGEMSTKTPSGRIWVDGVPYRGFICLRRVDGGSINVINIVELEPYLYSVVGQEMSPSWNIEALKAQAVCARTYALTHLNTYSKYGIDLCTTQNTQVYLGINKETESTIAAVDATRGQTVKYGGKTVDVYYFSSGGGSTEDSENVWMSPVPYLRGVSDPYENPNEATRYYWTISYTKDELKERMDKLGYNLGDIVSISIDERSDSGRVVKLTITGTAGSKTVEKTSVRSVLNLYSQQFDIKGSGSAASTLGGGKIEKSFSVLSSKGKTNGGGQTYNVLGAAGVQAYNPEEAKGDTFTFEGRGWGHSVGMSQWGAKAMADQGFSYIDILKFYFTGIEVSE